MSVTDEKSYRGPGRYHVEAVVPFDIEVYGRYGMVYMARFPKPPDVEGDWGLTPIETELFEERNEDGRRYYEYIGPLNG